MSTISRKPLELAYLRTGSVKVSSPLLNEGPFVVPLPYGISKDLTQAFTATSIIPTSPTSSITSSISNLNLALLKDTSQGAQNQITYDTIVENKTDWPGFPLTGFTPGNDYTSFFTLKNCTIPIEDIKFRIPSYLYPIIKQYYTNGNPGNQSLDIHISAFLVRTKLPIGSTPITNFNTIKSQLNKDVESIKNIVPKINPAEDIMLLKKPSLSSPGAFSPGRNGYVAPDNFGGPDSGVIACAPLATKQFSNILDLDIFLNFDTRHNVLPSEISPGDLVYYTADGNYNKPQTFPIALRGDEVLYWVVACHLNRPEDIGLSFTGYKDYPKQFQPNTPYEIGDLVWAFYVPITYSANMRGLGTQTLNEFGILKNLHAAEVPSTTGIGIKSNNLGDNWKASIMGEKVFNRINLPRLNIKIKVLSLSTERRTTSDPLFTPGRPRGIIGFYPGDDTTVNADGFVVNPSYSTNEYSVYFSGANLFLYHKTTSIKDPSSPYAVGDNDSVGLLSVLEIDDVIFIEILTTSTGAVFKIDRSRNLTFTNLLTYNFVESAQESTLRFGSTFYQGNLDPNIEIQEVSIETTRDGEIDVYECNRNYTSDPNGSPGFFSTTTTNTDSISFDLQGEPWIDFKPVPESSYGATFFPPSSFKIPTGSNIVTDGQRDGFNMNLNTDDTGYESLVQHRYPESTPERKYYATQLRKETLPDNTLLIEPSTNFPILNSPCNVLMNNAEKGRPNPFIQDVDYATSITKPVNYDALVSESATRSTIPESHYTQFSSINPRYEGSRISTPSFNTGNNLSSQYAGGVHALYYKPVKDWKAQERFDSLIPKGTIDLREYIVEFVSTRVNNETYEYTYNYYPNPNYGRYDPHGESGTAPNLGNIETYFNSGEVSNNYKVINFDNNLIDLAPGTQNYTSHYDDDPAGAQTLGLVILTNFKLITTSISNKTQNGGMICPFSPTSENPFFRTQDQSYQGESGQIPVLKGLTNKTKYPPSMGILELQYIINPDNSISQIQPTDEDLQLIKSLVTSPKTSKNTPIIYPDSVEVTLPGSGVEIDLPTFFNKSVPSSQKQIDGENVTIENPPTAAQILNQIQEIFGANESPQYLTFTDLGIYDRFPTGSEGIDYTDSYSTFGIKGTTIPFILNNTIGLALFNTGSKLPDDFINIKNLKGEQNIDVGLFPGGALLNYTINSMSTPSNGLDPNNTSTRIFNTGDFKNSAGGSEGLGGFIYPSNIQFTDSKKLPGEFLQVLFDNNIITPDAFYKSRTS